MNAAESLFGDEHVRRYRETGGEVGHIWREGSTILLLTTKGRTSGAPRTIPLIYAEDGGRYVIVDHSARAGTGISEGKTLHRIEEAVVRDEVRKAGFVLDAEGEFLRNPADTRDDSSGQPRVPTDKFVLRFVKPA